VAVNNKGAATYAETTQSLASGTCDLVFKVTDTSGNVYTASKAITVK
jgi:hypothetical protein